MKYMLLILIIAIIPIIGWFVLGPILWIILVVLWIILWIILVVLWIIGLVYSVSGNMKPIPVIGKYAEKINL